MEPGQSHEYVSLTAYPSMRTNYDICLFAVYLNDSVGGKITALDFDLISGNISNQRTLVSFQGTKGEPDGMVLE